MLKNLTVSPSPHISGRFTTRRVMLDVVVALVPAGIAAGYFFRYNAAILIAACVITAVVTERICNRICGKSSTIGDLSAVVTGLILAFSIPPGLPVWAAVIGSTAAIVVGKVVFGGLGANVFNPAMVGRALLTASFGMLMTTWTVPTTIDADMPMIGPETKINARTQATPLAWSKDAIKHKDTGSQKANRQIRAAFFGEVGGCLGETSALALLIGGIYLLIRRTISIHIPLAVLSSAFVFSGIFYLTNPASYSSPVFHLVSGGLLIGAFFIATDPVTAPLTRRGMWIFGIGVGSLTILIRNVGGYPEGVMYSVLLMNSMTPLIDRFCKLKPAGGEPDGG